MTSRHESERPYPESPVNGYFFEINDMRNGERDRIFAINTLCEKITGEPASEELLRQLLYEPGSDELASLERMATYPILVFGSSMEQILEPANLVVEYRRALQGLLKICQGRHDESCAITGPCVSAEEHRGERYPFCPIMDAVDFLAEGVICFTPESIEYQVDPRQQYKVASSRARALVTTNRKFADIYTRYLDNYRSKIQRGFFGEDIVDLEGES